MITPTPSPDSSAVLWTWRGLMECTAPLWERDEAKQSLGEAEEYFRLRLAVFEKEKLN